MRHPLCLIFSVLLITAFAGGVSAESAPTEQQPEPSLTQVALTEDEVTRFLASFPEAMAIGKAHGQARHRAHTPEVLLRRLGELPLLEGAQDELREVARRHGFDDTKQWAAVGQSVVLAHSYANSGRKPGEDRSQMAMAIDRIEKSPHVSEEDRKRFVEIMQESLGFVGAIEPPPANIRLIARMGDAVGEVLNQ